MSAPKKPRPSWTDVKTKLADFDRAGLLGVIQVLYAALRENQDFLHARFGLGEDALKPYMTAIQRWLWPDVLKNQHTSVANAKKAISDYKKAIGRPDDLAELMVHYCEQAVGFCDDVGYEDESYFNALLRMFQQALFIIDRLPEVRRDELLDRLDTVRRRAHNFGYGVGDEMDSLLRDHGFDA